MIFMIGSSMPDLIAKLYKQDPEIREIIDNNQPDMPRGKIWPSQPTDMFLRVWPQWDRSNFAGRFRYKSQGVIQEWPVRFHSQHGLIPMNSAQYRLWDEARTEMALGNFVEPQRVWVGMTQWPNTTDWNQDHLFLMIGPKQDPWSGIVIGLHFDSIMYPGAWRKNKDAGYKDWGFNSKGAITWTN
jgi:hypothetical protein